MTTRKSPPRNLPSTGFNAFEPALTRFRRDGWTPERQRAFIDALAETACVSDACRAVGMSTQSAYALRRTFEAEAFRLAWDAALDYAIRRLSDEVISRAINGVPVPHFYKGEQVGEHRRYDERLAMFLLRYRDPLRYARSLDRQEYEGHDELFAIRLARFTEEAAHAAEEADTPGRSPPDVASTSSTSAGHAAGEISASSQTPRAARGP
jgi:hypothetical protein